MLKSELFKPLLIAALVAAVPIVSSAQDSVPLKIVDPSEAAGLDARPSLPESPEGLPMLGESALPAEATAFRALNGIFEAAVYENGELRIWRFNALREKCPDQPGVHTLDPDAAPSGDVQLLGLDQGWILASEDGWGFLPDDAVAIAAPENAKPEALAPPPFEPTALYSTTSGVLAASIDRKNVQLALAALPPDGSGWLELPAPPVEGVNPAVFALGDLVVASAGASPDAASQPEGPWVWTFDASGADSEWERVIFPLVPGPGEAMGRGVGGRLAVLASVEGDSDRVVDEYVIGMARPRDRGGLASWTKALLKKPFPRDSVFVTDPRRDGLYVVVRDDSDGLTMRLHPTPAVADKEAQQARIAAAAEKARPIFKSFAAASQEARHLRRSHVVVLLDDGSDEAKRLRDRTLSSPDAKRMLRDAVLAAEEGEGAAELRERYGLPEEAEGPSLLVVDRDGTLILQSEGELDKAGLAQFLRPLWAPKP